MISLESILDAYIALENSVRQLQTHLFSETCGLCTACCCRADICEETVQSAFLSLLLKRQERTAGEMDDRYGWLDLHGCSLDYGRPPVCYAFFCDELLARLPDDETRWVIRILGRLMDYVGEHAVNDWHLVEIMNLDDLELVDTDALSLRLEEAAAAFDVIEQYVETGRLLKSDRDLLAAFAAPEA